MKPVLSIGVDYAAATRHAPGVGRYARESVRALVQLEPAPRLHLLDIDRGQRVLFEPALGLSGAAAVATRLQGELSRKAATWLARPLGVEAWFGGLDHVHQVLRPLWPVKHATTSLAISELPPRASELERDLRRDLELIDLVLVFSSSYQREVCERFEREPASVVRVPVGCDHWSRELVALPQRTTPPLVLVLGALRAERSPLRILRGFEALLEAGVEAQLLFAGRAGNRAAQLSAAMSASRHAPRLAWRDDLGEAQLPELLARASVLVHLSRAEGTAVTPLEAFAVGTAVVASPLPSFREALNDRAEWLVEGLDERRSAEQLSAALARAIHSASEQASIEARRRVAAPNTWRAHAEATHAAWRALARAR